MLAKAALPVTATLFISFAAMGQQATGVQPRALPGATTDAFAQMQGEAEARAAGLRRAWLASGHGDEAPPSIPPTITSGTMLVQSLDVTKPPAAPKVKLVFQTGNSGISSVYLYFYPASANGQQLYLSHSVTYHSLPVTQGTWTLQDVGDGYGSGAFNPYSSAGKWLLTSAYIYDQAGHYTSYGQAQLATAFGCSGSTGCITVKVTNGGTPDVTAPVITAGKILTPQVSLSATSPTFAADLTLSDDVSGVRYTSVRVCPPGTTSGCVSYTNYTTSPFRNGKNTNYDWVCGGTGHCNTTPTGHWTIYSFGTCDVAGNCVYDSDTTDILNLFGTTTFKVTN